MGGILETLAWLMIAVPCLWLAFCYGMSGAGDE